MEKSILELLGFDTIKESLKQYSVSACGADLIEREEPEQDFEKWQERQKVFINFKSIFDKVTEFPDFSFPNIENYVVLAAKPGSVLEAVELAQIHAFLKSAAVLKKFLYSLEGFEAVSFLGDFEEFIDLRNEIAKYIRPDGEIKEDGIKELVAIKKRIAVANRQLYKAAEEYFINSEYRQYWQEGNITMRDGRAVLPLKANFKGKVPGIIHASSARGNTIFIEPSGLVEKNNLLMELEDEYRREVLKILRSLSFKVGFVSQGLLELSAKIALFDSYYSRWRYTASYGGVIPDHSDQGLALYEARHLLLGKKAVPIDIIANKDINILLISGPNTGGKTVALKTCALIVLMNQFNLGLPVREGSCLPFFDNVLADIGDGQSIADSLSTFSSHMKNISHILEVGTARSLILLDEPGTGTDPDEGAAIALAVFDQIVAMGALALATTHQTVVKNYALTNPKAENVSVKYDPETFTPLYKLVYGMPGESFGIDIAGRNGMASEVIDKAREYLGSEKINISKLLQEISTRHAQLDDRERSAAQRAEELKEKGRALSLKEIQLRQQEYEIKKQESSSFRHLVADTSSRLENLVRELREGEITKEKTREVKSFINELHQKEEKLEARVESLKPQGDSDAPVYKPDDPVYVGQSKKDGIVIRAMGKGKYLVAVGQMRLVLEGSELAPGKAKDESGSIRKSVMASYRKPVLELDIRGYRLDEAIQALEGQMDSALLCGLSEFSVIHGTGEGILQKGVRDYLHTNRNVKSYAFARPEEGGFGKTIVKLVE